jgi:hypothetical protein
MFLAPPVSILGDSIGTLDPGALYPDCYPRLAPLSHASAGARIMAGDTSAYIFPETHHVSCQSAFTPLCVPYAHDT